MANSQITSTPYVLVTAAYNEEAFIEGTILSVIAQTNRPVRWMIVSDGSRDRTDDIVKRYAAQNEFIHLLRITDDHPRNFTAQVDAINAGVAQLKGLDYEFIGNLDADVSMGPEYFEQLLAKFGEDQRLGLGGGFIYEKDKEGRFRSRRTNNSRSVAHAVQLFRRDCFESIAAYVALPYGGPDSHAETMARIKGWRVAAFDELEVYHHRPSGSVGGLLHSSFRQGRMDYSLGYHPLFEVAKSLRRVWMRPYILGTLVRLAAFSVSYLFREKRPVSAEFIEFSRREQKQRLWDFLALLTTSEGQLEKR
jgi:poly-beta-1,6-N-acetyl-D-glucosamine synthase